MRPNAHTRIAHASCPDPTWALAWRCQCLHSAPINKYAYHTCANLIRACLISIYYTCIYERSELYKSEAYIEQVGHGRRAYAIIYQWYISIPLHSLSITRIYVTCSHCKRGHRTYSGQGMALPDRRRAHQCASVQQPCGEN